MRVLVSDHLGLLRRVACNEGLAVCHALGGTQWIVEATDEPATSHITQIGK